MFAKAPLGCWWMTGAAQLAAWERPELTEPLELRERLEPMRIKCQPQRNHGTDCLSEEAHARPMSSPRAPRIMLGR